MWNRSFIQAAPSPPSEAGGEGGQIRHVRGKTVPGLYALSPAERGEASANVPSSAQARLALPGKVNYFIGNDPNKWRTHIPTYAR